MAVHTTVSPNTGWTSGFQQAWENRVSAGVGKWLYIQPSNLALDKTLHFFVCFLAEEPKQRNPQWERQSVRNHRTFHQSHAQLAGHKAAVRTQTYVHAALDGLDVISVCGISPCRYIQTTVISVCNRLQPVVLSSVCVTDYSLWRCHQCV